jgi:hypothetical protein
MNSWEDIEPEISTPLPLGVRIILFKAGLPEIDLALITFPLAPFIFITKVPQYSLPPITIKFPFGNLTISEPPSLL